jgi:hypothetical protein
MISAPLTAIETELRQAAARRAYADVERLAVSIGAAAAQEARELPAGDPAIREIVAWLQGVYECTGILLRIARTAQADELRRLHFVKRYLPRQPRQTPQVRLEL